MKNFLSLLVLVIFLITGVLNAQFRGPIEPQAAKQGSTKNVAVELYKVKEKVYRKITALDGAEFAVAELPVNFIGKPLHLWVNSTDKPFDICVPRFSPGDSGITVRIDPTAGFTEIFGLKILDPVIIAILDDGTIEADRPGVRAVAFQGTVSHSACFLAAASSIDEQGGMSWSIGGFTEPPMTADGSMVRTPGEILECEVQLNGSDGDAYVSREVEYQGRNRILFLLAPPPDSPKVSLFSDAVQHESGASPAEVDSEE